MKIKTLQIYSLSFLVIIFTVVSAQAFQQDNDLKPASTTIKDLKKKGYTCEIVSLGFTNCKKCTTDSKGKESCTEYWCSSGSCVKPKNSPDNFTPPKVDLPGPAKQVSTPDYPTCKLAIDKLRDLRRKIIATSPRKLKRKQKSKLTKVIEASIKALQDGNGRRATEKLQELRETHDYCPYCKEEIKTILIDAIKCEHLPPGKQAQKADPNIIVLVKGATEAVDEGRDKNNGNQSNKLPTDVVIKLTEELAVQSVKYHISQTKKTTVVQTRYYENITKKISCDKYDVNLGRPCSGKTANAPLGYRNVTERVKKCCRSSTKRISSIKGEWIATYSKSSGNWSVELEFKDDSKSKNSLKWFVNDQSKNVTDRN